MLGCRPNIIMSSRLGQDAHVFCRKGHWSRPYVAALVKRDRIVKECVSNATGCCVRKRRAYGRRYVARCISCRTRLLE